MYIFSRPHMQYIKLDMIHTAYRKFYTNLIYYATTCDKE